MLKVLYFHISFITKISLKFLLIHPLKISCKIHGNVILKVGFKKLVTSHTNLFPHFSPRFQIHSTLVQLVPLAPSVNTFFYFSTFSKLNFFPKFNNYETNPFEESTDFFTFQTFFFFCNLKIKNKFQQQNPLKKINIFHTLALKIVK